MQVCVRYDTRSIQTSTCMKTTDVLAREAIVRSMRRHITREDALKEILKRERLLRPRWMTLEEAKKRRGILFRCVMTLIPHFEPGKVNAHYTGRVRGSKRRLERLRQESNGGNRIPHGHSSDVAVELLRKNR